MEHTHAFQTLRSIQDFTTHKKTLIERINTKYREIVQKKNQYLSIDTNGDSYVQHPIVNEYRLASTPVYQHHGLLLLYSVQTICISHQF